MLSPRYTLLPLFAFVALMVGLTALLQHSLFVYKLAGAYTHWAVILLLLPAGLGMLLRWLETESAILVIIVGAMLSALALFYLYGHYFWAQRPRLGHGLFLFAVIAGISHLPYAGGPVLQLIQRVQAIAAGNNKRRRNAPKGSRSTSYQSEPSLVQAVFNRQNTVSLIEMSVGIASLILSLYSVGFMGKS